jgi:uncharacterized protein (DUF2336 family)
MSFWSSLFGKALPAKRKRRYEAEKAIALSADSPARVRLAENPGTHQEILYYLAQSDPDPAVRRAVAGNMATPVHASPILALDKDQDVKLALAGRLVRLLPHLSSDKHSQLYAFSVQALGTLALDEVLKIRLALASALKDEILAPPEVVGRLARDLERAVSEPILRYCVALADADLLEILKEHPESWAVQAIAARPQVSMPVSQAVIETNDIPAGVALLENKGASISEDTLSVIVEKAGNVPEWQKPVAAAKNLPPDLAKRLAGFVDQSVRNLLLSRTDLDQETMDAIADVVRRRIDFIEESGQGKTPKERVRQMLSERRLDEKAISDALGVRDKDFVVIALAALVRASQSDIETIIAMHAPKPILAICWKAGLSMRIALQMQKELAQVPPPELIYPRGGTDYPLDKKELEWQLEFLGL